MMIREHTGSDPSSPAVWRVESVPSSLDVGFMLAQRGDMAVWDSVLAKTQSAGRGQLRRQWNSPPGNIYAAVRLPLFAPFITAGASVAIGLLTALALRKFGWPVALKWPNDLIVQGDGALCRKVGGILLEERGGVLLAGIGINVAVTPALANAEMRKNTTLDATSLAQTGHVPPAPEILWQQLVNYLYLTYTADSDFASRWKIQAEQMLLWRGETVALCEGETIERGILVGLSTDGGLCLRTGGQVKEFFSGTLRHVEDVSLKRAGYGQ